MSPLKSQDLYRILAESTLDMVYLVDREGAVLYVNTQAARFFRSHPADVIGKNLRDLFPPEMAERHLKVIRGVIETGQPVSNEVLEKFPGREVWIDARLSPVKDEKGEVIAVLGASLDISKRKQAESSLRESEEKYRTLVEQASDGIVIVQDGVIVYANPRLAKMDGTSVEEIVGTHFTDHIEPGEIPRLTDLYRRRMAGEKLPDSYETIIRYRNGITVPAELNARVISYEGRPADMLIIRDISRRKEAEEALRESEKKYRSLVENAPVGMYEIDFSTRKLTAVNDVVCAVSGYSREELLAMDPSDLIEVEHRKLFLERTRDAMAGREVPGNVEYKIRTKSGDSRWVLLSVSINRQDRVPVKARVVVTDITDRKRIEEALERSEAILKQAQQIANLGAWEVDVVNSKDINDNPLYWSDQVYRIFGYEPGSITITNALFFEHVHPDDRSKVSEAVTRAIAEKKAYSVEHRIVRKDGAERIVLEHAEIVFDQQDSLRGMIGTVQDITDRKQAEDALRSSQRQLSSVFDSVSDILFDLTVEPAVGFRFAAVNRAFLQTTGLSRKEVIGKLTSEVIPEPARSFVAAKYSEAVQAGKTIQWEEVSVYPAGTRHGEVSVTPIFDESGRCVRLIGAVHDITERKQAEDRLRESGLLYLDLANNPSAGIYRIRVKRSSPWGLPDEPPYVYEFVNDRYCELTGIPAEKHYSDPTITLRLIHPDDYANWAAANERSNRTMEPFFWEGRVIVKGVTRWFHYESRARSLPGGELIWTGILLDVTERKRLEEALGLIAKKYSTMFDNVTDGVWLIDLEGRILEVNDSYCRMSGYARRELIGMNISKLEAVESPDAVRAHRKMIVEAGQDRFESAHRRKDGSLIDLEIITLFMNLEGGRIAMLARDITQRKRVEAELRDSEQRYRTTLDSMADLIHVVDRDLNVILANKALRQFHKKLGISKNITGQNIFKIYSFLHSPSVQKQYGGVFASGKTMVTEEVTKVAGREIVTETRKIPIFEGGDVTKVLTIMRDISERLQAQRDQERLQKEILNTLTRQQIMIGQTLHDSLGQLLTGVAYMVKGIEHDQKSGIPADPKETARILALINNGISQTKSLSHMLYPAELERGDLIAALKNLADQTRVIYNVDCLVKVKGKVCRENEIVCAHLYRIVQEAVHNALKHGKASRITISLASRSSHVELSVADNGKGFNPRTVEGGLGIKILQYRAKEIGGYLAIKKNVPRGMIVSCRFQKNGGLKVGRK